MKRSLSQWALCELCKLADRDPQRGDRILEALWAAHPRLLSEIAIYAVDHNEITVDEAAEVLSVTPEELRSRVEAFRRAETPRAPIVEDDGSGIAVLAEGHVPVWEVVREFNKTSSMPEVAKAFPALSEDELLAAIEYGQKHPGEIDALITTYENMQDRKRSEYPYAR